MTNAEVLTIGFLNGSEALQNIGLSAFPEIPEDRPVKFVTVERVGGDPGVIIDTPMLAVQVWGADRLDASQNAEIVSDELRGMAFLPEVGRVEVNSLYNFPDPDSGQARYQMTVLLVTVHN